MIIELSILFIVLVYSLISTYTDIKYRIVLDYISYSMIILGLAGNLMISLFNGSFSYAAYSVISTIVVFLIGTLFFYAGIWMMGDTKILAGYAAAMPIAFSIAAGLPKFIAPWPFILTIWVNATLIAPVLVLIFVAYKIIKNWKEMIVGIKESLHKRKAFTIALVALLFISAILYFAVPEKGSLAIASWAVITLLFYLFIVIKTVDEKGYVMKKPEELIEGDIPIGLELNLPKGNLKFLKHNIKKHGLTQEQIDFIIKNVKEKLRIKEGFPMETAFFASVLLSLTFGDLLFFAFSMLI